MMVVYIHVQYMGGNHQIVHANHSHGHHATLTPEDDQTLQQTVSQSKEYVIYFKIWIGFYPL